MCDHSPRLREGRLQRQWEEIDALNERLAPFRILKGIEVNIRANGELDVDDETLAQLDWVMASVHASFDKDPTERVLHAMENPHVDCIGHLTSRRSASATRRRSRSSGSSRARSRPARSSRSTRSPTGSTSATRTPGSPARPA